MDLPVLIIATGAIAAGFVQGLSGFAFGMVAMSVWAWSVEPKLAAALSVFGALIGQIVAAFSVRRGFDLSTLLPFLLGGLAGIPIGVAVLPLLDIALFKSALGLFLVIWCPFMLLSRTLPRVTAGGRTADGVAGLAGGIMAGIGGFSGPVPTLWCTLRGMEKDRQRVVIQNFNLATLAFTMAAYVVAGTVSRDMLPAFGIVAIAVLIPVLLGGRVYSGLSEQAFRRIVLGLLTCSGVALLASGAPRVWAHHRSPNSSRVVPVEMRSVTARA